jgi:hypothetical protein
MLPSMKLPIEARDKSSAPIRVTDRRAAWEC